MLNIIHNKPLLFYGILVVLFFASCSDYYDHKAKTDGTLITSNNQEPELSEQNAQTQHTKQYQQDTHEFQQEDFQAEPPFPADNYFTSTDVVLLAKSVVNGDIESIEKLVAKGVDVNSKGKKGITPLIYVTFLMRMRHNYKDATGEESSCVPIVNIDGVKRLLELGADPNIQPDEGESAVSNAAYLLESDFLKILLSHGGKPNSPKPIPPITEIKINKCFWHSPLFNAISGRSTRNVRILIEAGADINCSDYNGINLLMHASAIRSYDTLYELLEGGADFHAKDKYGYNITHTIFQDVNFNSGSPVAKSRQKCLEFLEKHGVDLEKEKNELIELQRKADNGEFIEGRKGSSK